MAYTTDGTPVFIPMSSAPPATARYQPVGANGAATEGNGGAPALLGGAREPLAKKKHDRPRKHSPTAPCHWHWCLHSRPWHRRWQLPALLGLSRPKARRRRTLHRQHRRTARRRGDDLRAPPTRSTCLLLAQQGLDLHLMLFLCCRGRISKDHVILSAWIAYGLHSFSEWRHIKCDPSAICYFSWNSDIRGQ
uniref:Uncharacterized protein n=1 Tax=Arundo donax TaxID=35708 RepID=A0A0A9FN02_ARUDO